MNRIRDWSLSYTRNYVRSFSFVGLVIATLFFAASVSPSLLPRPYVVQGILSGFSLAVGYGVGVSLVWFWRFWELPDLNPTLARWARPTSVVIAAVVSLGFLRQMTFWQNSIRELMAMPPVETAYPYRIGLIALLCAIVLIFFSRLFGLVFGWVSQKLKLFLPQRIAKTLSLIVVSFLALILFQDTILRTLLDTADRSFARIDELSDDNIDAPESNLASGSSQSLVTWETIGRRGKNFVVQGPSASEIRSFTGRQAKRPLRIYVGLRSRPTVNARAQLALEELKRVGGFERKVLVIATPTGTGWLDPSAVDTLEYVHGGDTAIVSMQYSYLPSWISILVDPRRSNDAAEALFDAVYDHWTQLPKHSRPRLYLQGLSLGAMGSETSADFYTIFEDPIDGALFSGTPFPSSRWRQLVSDRNPGTPPWLPKFRDGSMVRFTNQDQDFGDDDQWGSMRTVYIQYASDPMVWFSPTLAFEQPTWLRDPRGPDVSRYVNWYPIVTFLQIGFDLPMATAVPMGHGHNYSPASYIDGWVAVTAPDDWTANETEKLKVLFEDRVPPGF